jgi:hypothetical protein
MELRQYGITACRKPCITAMRDYTAASPILGPLWRIYLRWLVSLHTMKICRSP